MGKISEEFGGQQSRGSEESKLVGKSRHRLSQSFKRQFEVFFGCFFLSFKTKIEVERSDSGGLRGCFKAWGCERVVGSEVATRNDDPEGRAHGGHTLGRLR